MALYRCGGGDSAEQKGACIGGNGVTNTFTTSSIDIGTKKAKHYVIGWYTSAASGGTKSFNWKLQGSSNNSTWTDIASGQKTTPASTYGNGTIQNDLSTNYRYYRLQFSQGGPGSVQSVGTLVVMYR